MPDESKEKTSQDEKEKKQEGSEREQTPDKKQGDSEESRQQTVDSKQGKIKTLEEMVTELREKLKQNALQDLKARLEGLEMAFLQKKVKDEDYQRAKKQIEQSQKEILEDKLVIENCALIVKFKNVANIQFLAGEFKLGDEIVPGATNQELYEMACLAQVMLQNSSIQGMMMMFKNQIVAEVNKANSEFFRQMVQYTNAMNNLESRGIIPGKR